MDSNAIYFPNRCMYVVFFSASAIKSTKRNKSKFDEMVIDKSYLACLHHLTMIGGLAFLPNIDDNKEPSATCLIIGLGGGALTCFLHQHLSKTKIDVVDIDATIVHIARQWFGFKDGDNLKVHVDNGIDFIKTACDEGKKYDVVILTIRTKL
ncbi:hypothetical protein SNE40_001272 [Patella caerulea]|uniref:PABS domain-containing protein n=1 Tax=Patella caerulea TaxID=87958 RepID=A0AAN8KIZ9_PATCE